MDNNSTIPTAITVEGRENQCCALAMDLVEKRLREGTASSQETTHFLKLATSRSKLEKENLELQNQLLKVKAEAIRHEQEREDKYLKAMQAFKTYSGLADDIPDEDLQ